MIANAFSSRSLTSLLVPDAAYLTWGCSVSAASAPSSTLLSRASWPWGLPGRSCGCARTTRPCAPSSWWPSLCPAMGAWSTTNWPRGSWISSAPTWSNHDEWSWSEELKLRSGSGFCAVQISVCDSPPPENHPGFLIDGGCDKRAHKDSVACSDFLLWAALNSPCCRISGWTGPSTSMFAVCKNSLFSSVKNIYFWTEMALLFLFYGSHCYKRSWLKPVILRVNLFKGVTCLKSFLLNRRWKIKHFALVFQTATPSTLKICELH